MRELEAKRDGFEIPNEESITAYYKIRQQLKRLGDEMLVRFITKRLQAFLCHIQIDKIDILLKTSQPTLSYV